MTLIRNKKLLKYMEECVILWVGMRPNERVQIDLLNAWHLVCHLRSKFQSVDLIRFFKTKIISKKEKNRRNFLLELLRKAFEVIYLQAKKLFTSNNIIIYLYLAREFSFYVLLLSWLFYFVLVFLLTFLFINLLAIFWLFLTGRSE